MMLKGKKMLSLLMLLFVSICIGITLPSTAMAEPSGKVIVFHAGSLTVPFAEIEKAFEKKYPAQIRGTGESLKNRKHGLCLGIHLRGQPA